MHRQSIKLTFAALALVSLTFTATTAQAQSDLTIEAVAAEPFGVGRVTASLDAASAASATPLRLELSDKDGRLFYPAFDGGPSGRIPTDPDKRPQQISAYFLFQGNEPLTITLHAAKDVSKTVTPAKGRPTNAMLRAWWTRFSDRSRLEGSKDDYPALVDNYLVTMLSRRLSLELPRQRTTVFGRSDLDQALGLLSGAETVRIAMQKETMLGNIRNDEAADLPLPNPVSPPAVSVPSVSEDVKVEAIASHVPVECFYLRFGNFPNYQWFRTTLEEWGGDLRNLLSVRGLDYGQNARIERQLVLKERALAALLGPQVIADVAVIGSDTFFREGGAFGMLFEARKNGGLARDIVQQRSALLASDKNVTEQKLTIAGHEVSFLSTPDNEVRSFYAVDGDYHFVTTSRTLVQRFYEAGEGKGSLAQSRAFRHARSTMPLDRQDTVFAYLSDEFFRNLVSPEYRVEMTRRLRAAGDLELLKVARLAAKAEHEPEVTVDELVERGFLPAGFGLRPDGTEPRLLSTGEAVDSLRGQLGAFTPIPDVFFDRVTASEAQAYDEFARLYQSQWQQMDPVVAGVRRYARDAKDRERIAIDFHATPFARRHYGQLTQFLGAPSHDRIAPVPGNMASLEIMLGGIIPLGRPTHVFGGLRDFDPPFAVVDGRVVMADHHRDWLFGYVGSWPELGILSLLGGVQSSRVDPEGYAVNGNGLWQRRFNRFAVASYHRAVLEEITPQLRVVEDPHPAQVRLQIADLSGSRVQSLGDAYFYAKARQISEGNADFLHSLVSQLHVPREQALAVGEELVDARLACPLGGKYELARQSERPTAWSSTAWAGLPADGQPPKDYHAPIFEWFRGLEIAFAANADALSVHTDVLMQRKPNGGFRLPIFSRPSGPLKDEPIEGLEEIPPPQSGDEGSR